MPTYPRRPPEPIVDHWTIDIYRLDDIVLAIDILITHYLYGDLILLVFLHKDRRHILVNILCQDGLDNHQVAVVIGCFDHT